MLTLNKSSNMLTKKKQRKFVKCIHKLISDKIAYDEKLPNAFAFFFVLNR